jgi:acetyl-CoA carboxylase biotin carboxyl carrier protein
VPLTEDDVRKILRLIDDSEGDELRVETAAFTLLVRRERAPAAEATPPAADGVHTIAAPILGTFYRASRPGAPPYVEVGSQVEVDTVVCLIEVMKMMNPIPAGVAGTIAEICVDNAELVEYGAPLFLVRSVS